MKLNTSLSIITVAFIVSLFGFVISVAIPQNDISDALMIAALFCAATSSVIAAVFTKKLSKSKQWYYVLVGGLLVLLSYLVKNAGFNFLNDILKVSGGVITILALGYYIYLHKSDFKNSKWIWFMPGILLGCLFKYMYWIGGNIILFGCLLALAILSIFQLIRLKKHTRINVLLIVWQLVMCVSIAVFYFRYVKCDYFIMGYLFTWLALVDILLQHEKNMLEDSEFK